jgi:glycosyltransferase involved in cell wall biosynthesis
VVIEIAAANFSPEKYYGGRTERFWRRLQKLALKRMLGTYIQAICMNSASHVPELRRQLGLPEDFIVECVGDTREIPQTPLDKSEARRRIGLAGYTGSVFLFFGTIRRDKGLDNLIRAFGMLPAELECRLVIAGMPLDWSPSEKARRILSDPRVVTRFEYIPEQEIDAYFYASDALVLPYAGFYAGSSGPLYEAGARGLPVIVSDVSEMGRIARERNLGIVVPSENPGALAEALKQFPYLDQEQKAQFSANALALVYEYDRSTVATRFVSVYQKLLERRQDVCEG